MPMSPETRASLLLRLTNSEDIHAWDEFVGIYKPVLFRWAIRFGMQAADADNLAQEVFISVARSLNDWLVRENRGGFRKWLLCVARNHALNLMSRKATRPLVTLGSRADVLGTLEDQRDGLSKLLEQEYERAVFQWAAAKVREDVADHTWQAFHLTQIDGLSVMEAASTLNTRVGQIYFARSRVMRRLQELVKLYEELQ